MATMYNLKGYDPNTFVREMYKPVDNSAEYFKQGQELRKRRGDKAVSDALNSDNTEREKIEALIQELNTQIDTIDGQIESVEAKAVKVEEEKTQTEAGKLQAEADAIAEAKAKKTAFNKKYAVKPKGVGPKAHGNIQAILQTDETPEQKIAKLQELRQVNAKYPANQAQIDKIITDLQSGITPVVEETPVEQPVATEGDVTDKNTDEVITSQGNENEAPVTPAEAVIEESVMDAQVNTEANAQEAKEAEEAAQVQAEAEQKAIEVNTAKDEVNAVMNDKNLTLREKETRIKEIAEKYKNNEEALKSIEEANSKVNQMIQEQMRQQQLQQAQQNTQQPNIMNQVMNNGQDDIFQNASMNQVPVQNTMSANQGSLDMNKIMNPTGPNTTTYKPNVNSGYVPQAPKRRTVAFSEYGQDGEF